MAELDAGRGEGLLIARLMEEGDSQDLRWLVRSRGEAALAAWLGRAGGRQLSRRSLLFWQCLLGREATPATFDRAEIWPL